MRRLMITAALGAAILGGLYVQGYLDPVLQSLHPSAPSDAAVRTKTKPVAPETVPSVSVVRVAPAPLTETLLVNGTLVPRTEVLVAPEIEGLKVLALEVEEGDSVETGQVLARLEQETLKVQLAQNDANLARARAAIAQARANIAAAEARQVEADNALQRARPLGRSGAMSDSMLDQRRSAALSANAVTTAARSGLAVSQAELAQIEAQRRDITWRLAKTEVKAPVAGVISRRAARVGAVATGSAISEPMFRIIAGGKIELEAEVPETELVRLQPGQAAAITIAGNQAVAGRIRLVAPEIDKATRQGRVRVALDHSAALRIGGFARGYVTIRTLTGLVLPASAVLYGVDGAFVQLVSDNRVITRKIGPGITAGDIVEIRSGLKEGDLVVAKAGTFLREGDKVRPVVPGSSAAEAN